MSKKKDCCKKKRGKSALAVVMFFLGVLIAIAGVVDITHVHHMFWGVVFLAGGLLMIAESEDVLL